MGSPPDTQGGTTLSRAIESMVRCKTRSGRRRGYLTGLEQYLKAFARGREQQMIGVITVQDLEDWFEMRHEPPATMRSNLGRLSALFEWAVRHGVMKENPVRRMEVPNVDRQSPRVLCLDECRGILRFTAGMQPRYLAYVILVLCCGLRPEEARQLSWEAVDLERGRVRVESNISKVHRRRIVDMEGTAKAWLVYAKQLGSVLPFSQSSLKRFVAKLRRALGMDAWPQDALRHSFASYHLAKHRNAERTSLLMGNSRQILLRHYRGLVTQEDAEAFWKLHPRIASKTRSK